MQDAVPLFIVFGIILVVGLAIYGYLREKKRREAFAALATRLRFHFRPGKDRSLARRYGFLDRLAQGSNRYAFNVLSGEHKGESVLVFDYHYETHSTDSKGRRQTHHHYFSVFILTVPGSFPELTVSREGFFSKVAQAFGYDDIDFESHEFSRKFCVRSRDKKFAYDVCNVKMIDYLLANDDLALEIEGSALAIAFSSRLSPDAVESNLDRLVEIRRRIPEYVFVGAEGQGHA